MDGFAGGRSGHCDPAAKGISVCRRKRALVAGGLLIDPPVRGQPVAIWISVLAGVQQDGTIRLHLQVNRCSARQLVDRSQGGGLALSRLAVRYQSILAANSCWKNRRPRLTIWRSSLEPSCESAASVK